MNLFDWLSGEMRKEQQLIAERQGLRRMILDTYGE